MKTTKLYPLDEKELNQVVGGATYIYCDHEYIYNSQHSLNVDPKKPRTGVIENSENRKD